MDNAFYHIPMLYMIRIKFYLLLGCIQHNHSLMRRTKEPDGKEECWMPMDGNYLWNSRLRVTEGSLCGKLQLQVDVRGMTL